MAIVRLEFPNPLDAGAGQYIAVGADLEPDTIISAYSQGIFPWYSEGDPILWHCPQPRCVLWPQQWHISQRSTRKIRQSHFEATVNTEFSSVIAACAAPRKDGDGTWLLPEMQEAYIQLHKLGYAHSVEIWQNGQLAGGLYGVALGHIFFGESMFHQVSEASRAAVACLIGLMRTYGFELLDCQQTSPHMVAMGAGEIPREEFLDFVYSRIQNLEPTPLAALRGPVSSELWVTIHNNPSRQRAADNPEPGQN